MEVLVIAIIGVIGLTPLAIWITVLIRSYQLEVEVELLIEEYRSRLNGSNRFLLDEQLLRQAFPEYSQYIIHKVWGKLVMTKAIERDMMDGSWCIK